MDTEQMGNEKITFAFLGSALGLFGRSLLLGLMSLLVIPIPWVMAWYIRWFVDHLRMSDNTQIAFVGTGKQIWLPVMALGFLNVLGYFIHGLWSFLLTLAVIPLLCYVGILVLRWLCENIVLSQGPKLSFKGTFLSYLGWMLLMWLSIFTIIGWAWVTVAMYRWICRNVSWEGHLVEFNGSGWGLLWRAVVFILTFILIIPIPWTILWLTKWYIRNISVRPVIAS